MVGHVPMDMDAYLSTHGHEVMLTLETLHCKLLLSYSGMATLVLLSHITYLP